MKPRRQNPEAGNAMVEFALSWAVLGLLFTGIFQYGYTIWVYNTLASAVENAAQTGAFLTYDTTNPATYQDQIKNLVVYGTTTAGTSTMVPGLTTANVSIDTHNVNGFPTNLTVAISNFTVNAVFRSQTFNKPRVTYQFMGRITCSGC